MTWAPAQALRAPDGYVGEEPACSVGDAGGPGLTLGPEDSLEEEMASRSSILAWEISWTEASGGLQSMGLQSQT